MISEGLLSSSTNMPSTLTSSAVQQLKTSMIDPPVVTISSTIIAFLPEISEKQIFLSSFHFPLRKGKYL
jgi:hypothetical protein